MRTIVKYAVLVAICMVVSVPGTYAAVETNATAPNFTLIDTNGQERSLSDFSGKHVVLEWVNYQCPFVKKHYQSGNMQKLQKDLTARDVIWLSINSSAEGKQGFYTSPEINEIIVNAGAHPTAYLIDTDGTVGKMYGAKTTPHMYIINPEGQLVYQGAIDSTPSFDPDDIPESTNYVTQAVNEALAGSAVSVNTTKSYGCSVKY